MMKWSARVSNIHGLKPATTSFNKQALLLFWCLLVSSVSAHFNFGLEHKGGPFAKGGERGGDSAENLYSFLHNKGKRGRSASSNVFPDAPSPYPPGGAFIPIGSASSYVSMKLPMPSALPPKSSHPHSPFNARQVHHRAVVKRQKQRERKAARERGKVMKNLLDTTQAIIENSHLHNTANTEDMVAASSSLSLSSASPTTGKEAGLFREDVEGMKDLKWPFGRLQALQEVPLAKQKDDTKSQRDDIPKAQKLTQVATGNNVAYLHDRSKKGKNSRHKLSNPPSVSIKKIPGSFRQPFSHYVKEHHFLQEKLKNIHGNTRSGSNAKPTVPSSEGSNSYTQKIHSPSSKQRNPTSDERNINPFDGDMFIRQFLANNLQTKLNNKPKASDIISQEFESIKQNSNEPKSVDEPQLYHQLPTGYHSGNLESFRVHTTESSTKDQVSVKTVSAVGKATGSQISNHKILYEDIENLPPAHINEVKVTGKVEPAKYVRPKLNLKHKLQYNSNKIPDELIKGKVHPDKETYIKHSHTNKQKPPRGNTKPHGIANAYHIHSKKHPYLRGRPELRPPQKPFRPSRPLKRKPKLIHRHRNRLHFLRSITPFDIPTFLRPPPPPLSLTTPLTVGDNDVSHSITQVVYSSNPNSVIKKGPPVRGKQHHIHPNSIKKDIKPHIFRRPEPLHMRTRGRYRNTLFRPYRFHPKRLHKMSNKPMITPYAIWGVPGFPLHHSASVPIHALPVQMVPPPSARQSSHFAVIPEELNQNLQPLNSIPNHKHLAQSYSKFSSIHRSPKSAPADPQIAESVQSYQFPFGPPFQSPPVPAYGFQEPESQFDEVVPEDQNDVSQPLPNKAHKTVVESDIKMPESHAAMLRSLKYGVNGEPLNVWIPIRSSANGIYLRNLRNRGSTYSHQSHDEIATKSHESSYSSIENPLHPKSSYSHDDTYSNYGDLPAPHNSLDNHHHFDYDDTDYNSYKAQSITSQPIVLFREEEPFHY